MTVGTRVHLALLGSIAGIAACSAYSSVTTVQIVSKVAGDSQTAVAGTILPIRPAVQVTDSGGGPISGVTVVFSVTTGGGSIGGSSVVTGADGIATSGDWKLGKTPGPNGVTAAVSNATVHFAATGLPPDTTAGLASSKIH